MSDFLRWVKVNRGHYTADDGRYEIVHLPEGWEYSDTTTGFSGTARTLRDAKAEIENH